MSKRPLPTTSYAEALAVAQANADAAWAHARGEYRERKAQAFDAASQELARERVPKPRDEYFAMRTLVTEVEHPDGIDRAALRRMTDCVTLTVPELGPGSKLDRLNKADDLASAARLDKIIHPPVTAHAKIDRRRALGDQYIAVLVSCFWGGFFSWLLIDSAVHKSIVGGVISGAGWIGSLTMVTWALRGLVRKLRRR